MNNTPTPQELINLVLTKLEDQLRSANTPEKVSLCVNTLFTLKTIQEKLDEAERLREREAATDRTYNRVMAEIVAMNSGNKVQQ